MNANELADELCFAEMDSDEIETWAKEARDMLLQQHKELEHMWMANTVLKVEVEALKAKTLTDDEILQVYSESEIWVPDRDESDLVEFARAILRKAQEK